MLCKTETISKKWCIVFVCKHIAPYEHHSVFVLRAVRCVVQPVALLQMCTTFLVQLCKNK
jgi:hypothetical protein